MILSSGEDLKKSNRLNIHYFDDLNPDKITSKFSKYY